MNRSVSPAILLLAVLLAGCAAGPDYVRPAMELPPAYKATGPWKPATPAAAESGTAWWRIYQDPVLDSLVDDAMRANQTLRVSEAQYRQAHALSSAALAGLYPTLNANASASRARTRLGNGSSQVGDAVGVGFGASWVPDLWGSVRRSVEAARASEAASADDLAGAKLAVQASVVQDYLSLRVTDVQRDLYAATTAAYAKALQLTQSQYRAGVVLRSDVALAESQYRTAQAQAVDLAATRAQLENAIAILTGRAPSTFSLASQALTMDALRDRLPAVPAGVPSELLQRRPDIAAAERRAAAANANIGVAQAAFYPSLVLSGTASFNGAELASLFDTPGRLWSLGASLAQTVFDGGLKTARREQAVAAYDAAAAQYKETVLSGLQEVENNLALLRLLEEELAFERDAVAAAQLAERSALAQYRAGSATFLAVVTAQTLALTNARTAVQLVGRELAASVSLVVAMGGGWTADQAQTLSATETGAPAR